MVNNTTINEEVQVSATQINNDVINNVSSSNTIVNSALYNSSQIPVGTILCNKYKVVSTMNIMSGEASLFICEYNTNKYVAKLYRRDVAIKNDVINALKNIVSPNVAKLYDCNALLWCNLCLLTIWAVFRCVYSCTHTHHVDYCNIVFVLGVTL